MNYKNYTNPIKIQIDILSRYTIRGKEKFYLDGRNTRNFMVLERGPYHSLYVSRFFKAYGLSFLASIEFNSLINHLQCYYLEYS